MSLVRELSRICVVEKQQALPYNDMFVPRCHYVNADIGVLHAVIADTDENKLNKDTPITYHMEKVLVNALVVDLCLRIVFGLCIDMMHEVCSI